MWQSIVDWYKQPFRTGGSAFNWVLFVGLLIVAVWFWHIILLQIKGDL
jgi:hypothetical protein